LVIKRGRGGRDRPETSSSSWGRCR